MLTCFDRSYWYNDIVICTEDMKNLFLFFLGLSLWLLRESVWWKLCVFCLQFIENTLHISHIVFDIYFFITHSFIMANTKQIKWKIKSVANLEKMTKALEVVSTVKLQRIKEKTEQYKEFVHEFLSIVSVVTQKTGLMNLAPTGERTLVVMLSTDKWLCGWLNSKLFSHMYDTYHGQEKLDVYCVGKKSLQFCARSGFNVVGNMHISDDLVASDLDSLIQIIRENLTGWDYTRIVLGFNYFHNPLKQVPFFFDLFPMNAEKIAEFFSDIAWVDLQTTDIATHEELVIEPDIDVMKKELTAQLIQHMVYWAVLQNKSGEFASRMIAMKNAKDNAWNIIADLKLMYNKARQAAITQEVSEIVSAKMALEEDE